MAGPIRPGRRIPAKTRYRSRTPGSTSAWLCLANIAVLPCEDEFRGTDGVLKDITERRRREQRMEVMDRILRHNLRNEMNVVRGRAEMIRRNTDGAVDEHLDEIESAGGMTSSPSFTTGFPPWESQPVYDSPEATFPSRWTVLGSVRCSLGRS